MKVFISWSGTRSKAVGLALRIFLENVIQDMNTFMSEEDIEKGTRAGAAIAENLESTDFGVICITPENQLSRWLHFEAGALSKVTDHARVAPFLIDMSNADLQQPLAMFQATQPTEAETWLLVESLNKASERKLEEPRLKAAFEQWWPSFNHQLQEIPTPQEEIPPQRMTDDKVDEILGILRSERLGPRQVGHSTTRLPPYVRLWLQGDDNQVVHFMTDILKLEGVSRINWNLIDPETNKKTITAECNGPLPMKEDLEPLAKARGVRILDTLWHVG